MVKRLSVMVFFTAVSLATAATALAGTGTEGYGGVSGVAQTKAAGVKGTLPFTGLNLALVVVGGLVLLATGLLLRRRGVRPSR